VIRVLSIQPFAERGGSDQALLGMVRSLPPGEFECHVVVPAAHPLGDDFARAGAVLHEVPMRPISTRSSVLGWVAYVLAWVPTVVRIARVARRVGADVVHTNSLHSWYGWAVALVVRRPHVWHARELVTQSRAALAVERFLTRRFAAVVVAVSRPVAAQLSAREVVVVHDAPDPEVFAPSRAGVFRREVGVADGAPLAGFAGRLDRGKGIEVLLAAWPAVRAAVEGAELLVVGPPTAAGDAQAVAAAVARTEGARMLDARPELATCYADLDVLVLPSTLPESYGLVVAEALVAGCPVVASAVGGPVELAALAEPGAVRLVAPGDDAALAAAVAEVLAARGARSAAERAARPRLLVLPPPAFADLFRRVAGTRARAAA
jgi:glycosyltransferase involved in cell wall biosynthesis